MKNDDKVRNMVFSQYLIETLYTVQTDLLAVHERSVHSQIEGQPTDALAGS